MAFDGGSIKARLGLDRKGFDRGLKGSHASAKKWDRSMGMLFKGGLMATGIGVATRQLFKFTDASARLVDMGDAFDRLAEREGIASEQIIGDVKGITKALSRRQIMETGNMLDLLGVGVRQLPKFTRIAQAAGVALNRSTADMLESLSVGTARQSKLWLDNLGILISLEEANKNYAKQLGITTGAMTDQQKRAGFLNAVLEKGEDIIRKVSGGTELQAEKTASLASAWQDAKDALGEYLVESLKLPDVLKKIADQIERGNKSQRDWKQLRKDMNKSGLKETGTGSDLLEFLWRGSDVRKMFAPEIRGLRTKTNLGSTGDPSDDMRRLAEAQGSPSFTRPVMPFPAADSVLNMSQLEVVKGWKEIKLTTTEIKRAHEDYAHELGVSLKKLKQEDRLLAEGFAKIAKAGPVGQPATGDLGGRTDPRQGLIEARQRRLKNEADATKAANKELSNFIRGIDDSGKAVVGLSQNIMQLGNAASVATPILRGTTGEFPRDLTGTGQPRDLRGVPTPDMSDVGPVPGVIDSGAGIDDIAPSVDIAALAINNLSGAYDALAVAMANGGNAGKAFAAGLLDAMSAVAKNLGFTLILTGIGVESLKLLQGAAAIAAGLGLLAISGIMGAGARSIGGGASSSAQPRNTRQPSRDPSKDPGGSITVHVENFIGKKEFVTELMTEMNNTLRKGGNAEVFYSPA